MLEFIGFIRRESSFVRLKQRTRIVLCARVLRSLIRRDIRHKERLDNRSIEVERVYSLETNNRVRRFVYICLSLSLSRFVFNQREKMGREEKYEEDNGRWTIT